MHFLITGGMGFIGHNLVKHCLDSGNAVTIVDNLDAHAGSLVKLTKHRFEQIESKKCSFLQLDCIESHAIKDKFSTKAPDYIIHLAGLANQAAVTAHTPFAVTSIPGRSMAVAELAKFFNARLVHVSSSMVYGDFTRFPQPEDADLKPKNLYGLLKKQSEELVQLTYEQSVIVRPSAVYGPGDSDQRVLAKWIRAFLNNEDVVVNDPSSCLDFTHVNDLVKGILGAAVNGHAGQAYNLTYGQARSLGEAALLIKHMTNSKSNIVYGKPLENDPARGALDIGKAAEHFGYAPKIDLHNGLISYIEWMQDYAHVY